VVNLRFLPCPHAIIETSFSDQFRNDREFVAPVSVVSIYALSSRPLWLRKNL